MIARKIERAVKTLNSVKCHLEPAVWKSVNRSLNVLLEEAAKVRKLEARMRAIKPGPQAKWPKESFAEIGAQLKDLMATLGRVNVDRKRPELRLCPPVTPKTPPADYTLEGQP